MTSLPLIIHGLTVRNRWANRALRWVDSAIKLFIRKKQKPLPSQPKRILIANIANLGDVVIATTIIPALQRQFPNAKFGFLAGHLGTAAAVKHPLITHVHTFAHFWRGAPLKKHFRSARQARKEILALHYDFAIDLHPYYPNAIPLLHRCRIPHILGYTMGGFSSLLTHPYSWKEITGYMGQMHLEMLRHFGLTTDFSPSLHFYCSQPLLQFPYAVVHMGSSKPEKDWNKEAWIQCIQELKKHLFIVLTGKGAKEEQECAIVAKETGALNLSGKLDWTQFATTIQHAELLISVDSAAVHLAASSQTPTIIIFCGINSSRLWAPPHPNCKVLMEPVPCAPCFNKRGCSAMTCIKGISPNRVVQEALLSLKR